MEKEHRAESLEAPLGIWFIMALDTLRKLAVAFLSLHISTGIVAHAL
jgi:hypothetical protein